MYDVYHHVTRADLQLILPRGEELPERVPKANWQLSARRFSIPRNVADEIGRSGFSIIRLARPTLSTGR
jgi:hypothetical protein